MLAFELGFMKAAANPGAVLKNVSTDLQRALARQAGKVPGKATGAALSQEIERTPTSHPLANLGRRPQTTVSTPATTRDPSSIILDRQPRQTASTPTKDIRHPMLRNAEKQDIAHGARQDYNAFDNFVKTKAFPDSGNLAQATTVHAGPTQPSVPTSPMPINVPSSVVNPKTNTPWVFGSS